MDMSVSASVSASMSDVIESDSVPIGVIVFVVLGVMPAGEGLTIVVLVSVLVPGDAVVGATVSVLCSHAARSEALARMQMYFFIIS